MQGGTPVPRGEAASPPTQLQRTMRVLEQKLNGELGFNWWKRYVAVAFWSNVSTPVNLAITMFTALTTAQASSSDFMPHSAYVGLSVATLVISVLNTFFRPHTQMSENIKLLNSWNEFGSAFEEIYYSSCFTLADYQRRTVQYQALLKRVLTFQNTQSPEMYNAITDLVYMIAHRTCLKSKEGWLDMDSEAMTAVLPARVSIEMQDQPRSSEPRPTV